MRTLRSIWLWYRQPHISIYPIRSLYCADTRPFRGLECTYNQPASRGRDAKKYIEALESRLRKAEALLKVATPDIDLNDPHLFTAGVDQRRTESSLEGPLIPRLSKVPARPPREENRAPDVQDESPLETVMENLGSLNLDDRGHWDYRGHSSSTIFVQRLHNQFGNLIIPPRFSHKAWPMAQINENVGSYCKLQQDPSCPLKRTPTYDLPRLDAAKLLCRNSLQHACVLLRFVHEPSFWSMVDRIYATPWDQFGTEEHSFLPLLYIVIAVGCVVSDDAEKTLNVADFEEVTAKGYACPFYFPIFCTSASMLILSYSISGFNTSEHVKD